MIQFILFAILVVMTPFIVVTRFLQGAVHNISHFSFTLFGHSIPFAAMGFILAFVLFIVWQWKHITPRKIGGGLVIVGMIAISQWVQDLYGGMSIYDLQRNWHYIAYSTYVFFFFRAFNLRDLPIHKSILYSYFSAISLSLFDETFQFFLSHRVFDVSDIAKDSWGCMMGLVMIFFVSETYGTIRIDKRRFWKKRFGDYFKDPLTALVMVSLLALVTIMITPLLTDHKYAFLVLGLSVAAFAVLFVIIHYLQFKPFRIAFISIVAIIVLLLGGSVVKNHDRHITHNSYGWTVYAGIPVPFFDLMIYPNGLPRLVDKKHFFNNQDKKFLLELNSSILLIGSGSVGRGGKGFNIEKGTYFTFNHLTTKGTQVIILKTPEACRLYNRLRHEGKNVLFVIHNTC